ncbi:hypothetical protein P175DRAFT_0502063 [Aspergillus ochraceoroseus IBT 24754]|uniref:Copper-fist domain-containing protein n=1 Tax=Aspergillus ochraceoroseus IBT 24754 TaxID=1392256 RepID=A0A2T5LUD0_9EURO|nr:uncharacterized protein P175DRAFT_0502063 [Aspergillus ochraceoroseus IBT 24754]PTU19888.1 hypothetical protein P175DRAFT_0502063 [Aspergillus ochraceoroseus IBT 24754]
MLIDGEKWACEACVRGHRVTTCKHHDRPLIRINRKGRPFSTCLICNCTPCESPDEHNKLKREAEMKSQSSNRASGRHARSNPSAFLPIAPRPSSTSPPSSIQPSPRPGYSCGSQFSDNRAPPAASAGGARGAPQGVPYHRTAAATTAIPSSTRSPTSLSHPQAHLGYASHANSGGFSAGGGISPLNMPLTSPPPLCCLSDIPVSMSMVSPFDTFGDHSLVDGGTVAFPSLEDIDLNSFHGDILQEDWSWLSEDHLR